MNETTAAPPTEAPKPEKPPVLITLAQAAAHRSKLERKMCYVYDANADNYWPKENAESFAWTKDPLLRRRISAWDTLENWSAIRHPNLSLHLLDQDLAELILKKKCGLDEVLKPQIITLLQTAPKNPQARAHVLAATGKMPPEELTTFEQVRDWIEESVESPNKAKAVAAGVTPPANPATTVNAFSMNVCCVEDVRGRCDYSVQMVRWLTHCVTNQVIQRVLTENPNANYVDLAGHIHAAIENELQDDPPTMTESNDGYDYSEYEQTDSDGLCVELRGGGMHELRAKLSDYLRATLPPEEQRRRGM